MSVVLMSFRASRNLSLLRSCKTVTGSQVYRSQEDESSRDHRAMEAIGEDEHRRSPSW